MLLDIQRAFTNVCPDRLEAVLIEWRFHTSFVGWVKALTKPRKVHILHKKRLHEEASWHAADSDKAIH